MARIGIYGGTFNPIHKTHIEIAKAALEQFELDCVNFLVAGDPPHKDTAEGISVFNRLEMVKLAIENYKDFYIDDREVYRSGKSYSYITLAEYKSEHPDDEIFFIMGTDSFVNFSKWVKPEEISDCCTILAAPRLGDDEVLVKFCLEEYKQRFSGDFALIDYEANGISSTEVRNNIDSDEIQTMIPEKVYEYILYHGLYLKSYEYEDVRSLSRDMKDVLKPGRYEHTIGVANTAYNLALQWDYNPINAMVAGMLHDCAKCISDEKRIKICKENNIEIKDIEYDFPHLLHGKAGAYLAKNKYGISNKQILHSIEVHTIGCIDMNLLDKIIYVADYIEPGRNKQPRLDFLRKLAYEDLDLCVFYILEDTVAYLDKQPDIMDPTTLEIFNYYKELRGN